MDQLFKNFCKTLVFDIGLQFPGLALSPVFGSKVTVEIHHSFGKIPIYMELQNNKRNFSGIIVIKRLHIFIFIPQLDMSVSISRIMYIRCDTAHEKDAPRGYFLMLYAEY